MRLIKKYSDYIRWPIQMDVQRPSIRRPARRTRLGTPKYETVNKTERETVNSMVPIWQALEVRGLGRGLHELLQGEVPRHDGPLPRSSA